jgi:hypothetical protein
MIGALALGFLAFEAGFVRFGGIRRGQICGLGDMARDTVSGNSSPAPVGASGASGLPASMKLLGDWNRYLPSWVEWLRASTRGRDVLPPHGAGEPPTRGGPGASEEPQPRPVPA